MPTVIISDNTTGVGTGTYTGTPAVFLRLNQPTTNQNAITLEITKYGAGDHSHTVLAFTGLSNIPAGSTVTSVTLGLYQSAGDGTYAIDIRRVLKNWVETEATWNNYSTAGGAWTTGGCLSDGNDRIGTVSGQYPSFGTAVQFHTLTQTSGGLVDDVQAWVNGTASNYGWHFMRSDAGEDFTFKQFVRDEGTDGQRPYLSVTYTEAKILWAQSLL